MVADTAPGDPKHKNDKKTTNEEEEEEEKREEDNSETNEDQDPQHTQARPQVASLLSFPNSGTSYTMTNTEHVTGQKTASNYARGWKQESLIAWTPQGPFSKHNPSTKIPQKYILTQTHCTGFCHTCPPSEYVVPSLKDFMHGCQEAFLRQSPLNQTAASKTAVIVGHYKTPAARAIYLIRHPLDNLVSRMHMRLKQDHRSKSTDFDEMVALPTERQRLDAWCRWMDERHEKKLKEALRQWFRHQYTPENPPSVHWPFVANRDDNQRNETMSLLVWETHPHYALRLLLGQHPLTQHIPCRVELFRYVQWHARVWQMTHQLLPNVPVHRVYYESYWTHFNATVNGIVKFLKQQPSKSPLPFVANMSFVDTWFTPTEQVAMGRYIQTLTNNGPVWSLLRHYFEKSPLD